ncbi:peptidoglycan binding protein CsiV [Vibrio rhizosphaerae]|uniref:Peptidoglycan binding protein CsiV n=1 Tax=Vibrio rhizosphaerae TaxID=398736 RepID=A0ABU4ITA5_9VIBR|nr:peptidoglycan binding protein CsiV [Vibrio rhizosphaerae]MDW6092647.1 peptidoglycan binding protein CsiV [Vibrio rhizosphaerae]
MNKLIPLLMLLIAMPSWAQRQFDIEVIIFKRVVNAEQTNETWPNVLPPIDYQNTGSLSSQAYLNQKGVTLLPASEYKLDQQEESLRNHAGFQVLLHTAWRQNDDGKSDAPAFHLLAGKDYSSQFHPDGREITPSTVAQQSPIEDTVEKAVPKPLYELDGKLQVYVQHYLYVDALLDLKEPSVRDIEVEETPADFSQNTANGDDDNVQFGHLQAISPTVTEERFLKPYRLDQKRRMRSGETLYFDHPLMGIILQVRKVQDAS